MKCIRISSVFNIDTKRAGKTSTMILFMGTPPRWGSHLVLTCYVIQSGHVDR